MNKCQFLSIRHLCIWFLYSISFSIQVIQSTTIVPMVDFDQGMICHPRDVYKYKKACTNNQNDQFFFNFARSQYSKYIEQAQGYSDNSRIPKIIHQIWIGPNNPPKKFKEWQQTWIDLHPDWQYKLWTDQDVENIIMINKEYYDQEENYGAKADILRLEILNLYGGLYVDVDFECLKPFDLLHHLCDFYIGFFQVNFLNASARIATGLIAAKPGHPLIQRLIEEIKNNRGNPKNRLNDILQCTGPSFVTKIVKQNLYDTPGINIVFPSNYFYSWTGSKRKLQLAVQPETMAVHYYTGTWHEKSQKINTPKRNHFKNRLECLIARTENCKKQCTEKKEKNIKIL